MCLTQLFFNTLYIKYEFLYILNSKNCQKMSNMVNFHFERFQSIKDIKINNSAGNLTFLVFKVGVGLGQNLKWGNSIKGIKYIRGALHSLKHWGGEVKQKDWSTQEVEHFDPKQRGNEDGHGEGDPV